MRNNQQAAREGGLFIWGEMIRPEVIQRIAQWEETRERRRINMRDEARETRAWRKERGLCMRCGKEPAEKGGVNCTACRLWVNQSRSGYTGRGRNRRRK